MLKVPSGKIKMEVFLCKAAFKLRKLLALFSGLLLSTIMTAARYTHPKMGIFEDSNFPSGRIGWCLNCTIGGISI